MVYMGADNGEVFLNGDELQVNNFSKIHITKMAAELEFRNYTIAKLSRVSKD